MSKRIRGKSAHPGTDRGRMANKYIGSEVFRNSSAVCDDTDPHQSLKYLIEIFNGKIEEDVISMIFSECEFNVDQSLETLMSLSSDEHEQQTSNFADQQSENSDNYLNSQQTVNQTTGEVSVLRIDTNTLNVDEKHNYVANSDSPSNTIFHSLSAPIQSPSSNSSKSEPKPFNSYPSTSFYGGIFQPSNLTADSLPTSISTNFSPGSFIQLNKMAPEFVPNPQFNNAWTNSLNFRTPKRYKGPVNQPKSSPSKNINKKHSPADMKWKEDADRLRRARDLIKSGFSVLVILRGLPGSGKSTLAKTLKFSGVIFSTDDFFGLNGEYNFDPIYLQEAHEWNKNRAFMALSQKVSPVIIDNTNTEAWEMAPYVNMGKKFNFNIVILEPVTAWKFNPSALVRRNQHGVRKETIIRMLERYQHNITIENFSQNLNMPKYNEMPVSDISSKNNSLINHNSNSVIEAQKSSEQLVSLEAVIHQEEKSFDSLLSENIEHTNGNETTDQKFLLTNEFPSSCENKSLQKENNILFSTKCPKCTEKTDALENMASTANYKAFESLEELKALVQEDSDDTLSFCNDCILLQASVDEDTSWEKVTEPDNDFLWNKPTQGHSSNSSLSSLQLQNDCTVSIMPDDVNTDTSNTNQSSSERELVLKPIFQKDSASGLTEKLNNISLLDNSINTYPGKLSNVLQQNSNNEALPLEDEIPEKSLVLHSKTSFDKFYMELLSSKDVSYAHIQENNQLSQNFNSSSSKPNFDCNLSKPNFDSNSSILNLDNSISFKYENSHKSNLDFENTKPSPRKLSSRSFDECLVFRETKTKEVERNVETNLLRSKFHSVPFLKYQDNVDKNSVEDSSIAAFNSSLRAVEKDTDLKKSVKSCLEQHVPNPETQLWISDDLDEISSWENKELQNISSIANKTKTSNSTWDKDCNHNLIIKDNSVYDSMNPKPQRTNSKKCLGSIKNFKEYSNAQTFLTLNNDWNERDAALTWDDTVKIEQKNEDSVVASNEPLQAPKPQRTKSNNMLNFLSEDKLGEKNEELRDTMSSPIISQSSQHHRKKRSPLLKHVEKYLNSDWTFPQFLTNETDTIITPKENFIPYYNAETQTEPSDFVKIFKIETCNYISDFRIITSSENIYANSGIDSPQNVNFDTVIPLIPRFEKSTSTDDLIKDTKISEKIGTLQECFPDISEEDLSNLLDLCHEDETWLINLLLDSGYKYNNPNPEEVVTNSFLRNSPSEEIQNNGIDSPSKTEELYKNEDKDGSNPKNVCSDVLIKSEPTVETSTENKINPERETYFPNSSTFEKMHLILDSAFAMQLEELFGQVDVNAARTVEIDLEFAKLIYDKWKNTAQSKASLNSIVDNKTKGKKNRNQPFSKFCQRSNLDVPKNSNESMSFSEIMDMEYALQVHKKQKLKTDADFATKLSRIELYNMYPGADPIALDEIFESNNCSLKNSVIALGEDIGKPTFVKRESDLKEIERANEYNQLNIWQEFENNDWSDWVSREANFESGKESPPYSIPPEAEDLRNVAAEHCVLRQQFIQKAQEAHGRGMRDAASFYAQKGHEHALKFKEASKAACDLIVQQRNSATSSQVLDLHGLFVQEAIPYVDEFLKAKLQKVSQNSLTKVSIITGLGNHSIRGPKLRPSVMEYLKKAGYRFAEVNRGVLEIYLKSE